MEYLQSDNVLKDYFMDKVKLLQKKFVRWCAQRPAATLITVTVFGVILLPAVTIVILTPIAFLFNHIGVIATAGSVTTIYAVLFKGFLLAVFLLGVLVTGFLIITCVSVMHSYKLFSGFSRRKNM